MSISVPRAIVSGATGFVGRSLLSHLESGAMQLHLGEPDWREQIGEADYAGATVFHLAARAHGDGRGSEAALIHDNVDKTLVLARAAAAGGAGRFVFLSSIKVNGEETRGVAFRAQDPPAPEDAYGRSKWQAEQALAKVAGLAVTTVRAPLVYGPGVKGNLLALLRLCDSALPLPFDSVRNLRSFVHVDDLARLLVECAALPHAAGRTFLAGHADRASTPRLVAAMRDCLGKPRRLLPMPVALLEGGAWIAGQGARMRRLTRSLEIDVAETRLHAGWTAQISFDTAVEDMARSYRESLA
jgi:UDP-glucose 4-epimerase